MSTSRENFVVKIILSQFLWFKEGSRLTFGGLFNTRASGGYVSEHLGTENYRLKTRPAIKPETRRDSSYNHRGQR